MRRLDPECYCTEINYRSAPSQRTILPASYKKRPGDGAPTAAKWGSEPLLDPFYIIRCGERRQGIASPYTVRKRTEKVPDTVGVIAHQWTIPGKYCVASARFNQHPTHVEHPPRAIENLIDRSVVVDHSRVELGQHVAHLGHPRDQA